MIRIGLDPGHGRGKNPKATTLLERWDPGVVDQRTGRTEADAVLELCKTIRFVGLQQGVEFVLTHDGTEPGKGSLYDRMVNMRNEKVDAVIAVHANMMYSYGLVYKSYNRSSARLAEAVDDVFRYNKVWASAKSNHGGLYIDDFVRLTGKPAILWEVAAIDKMPPPGDAGRLQRLALANSLVYAVKQYFGVKK